MKLLATNAKLEKIANSTVRYLIAGLTLAPHTLGGFGTICDGASWGCMAACNLWFSGRRVSPQARARAKRQTAWFFEDRPGFLQQLNRDIAAHVRSAEKLDLRPVVRLNVASDLDWTETIENWPGVVFYDYVKIRSRFSDYLAGKLPENYSLTFSRHEKHHSATIASYLRAGGNVAQVFDVLYNPAHNKIGRLPKTVKIHGKRWPVVDGDLHDLRLPNIDGRGVVVGLRLKGTNKAKERARKSGFAFSV